MSTSSLLTFIEELRTLVKELTEVCEAAPLPNQKEYHCLSRPGLRIYSSDNASRTQSIEINVLNKPALIISSGYGQTLTTYYKVPCGGGSSVLPLLGPASQVGYVPENWQDHFSHAIEVLEKSIVSIQHDVPLESNLSWPQALRSHLQKEDPSNFKLLQWNYWVDTWGTPEMKTVLDIADGIVSSNQDLSAWKELVLISWINLEIPSLALDPGVSLEHAFRY